MVALPSAYQYRKTPITAVVPIVRLTPTFSYDHFLHRVATLFKRTLCYYSLIYYTGDPRAKEPPVVGVLVVCPGSDYIGITYDLHACGLLPRSKRWKEVREWLEGYEANLPETPRELELERQDLARIQGRHHLLDLSPVHTTFDHPALAGKHLYEEHTMSKSGIRPTVHEMIERRKHTMEREEVLFYLGLVEEKLEETSQKDVMNLLARFVLLSNDHNDEERKQAQQVLGAVELVLGL